MPNKGSQFETLESRRLMSVFNWSSGSDGNWTDPANWTFQQGSGPIGAGYPTNVGDQAQFIGGTTANRTVTIPDGVTITVGVVHIGDNVSFTFNGIGFAKLVMDSGAVSTILNASVGGGTGTDTFNVPIILTQNLVLNSRSTGLLTLAGGIGEAGGAKGLTKIGTGTLRLASATGNSYTGGTSLNEGTLELASPAGQNSVRGQLSVGNGSGIDTVRLLNNEQILNTAIVAVNQGATLDLNNHSETIDMLNAGPGTVAIGTATLTTGNVFLRGGTISSSASGKLVPVGFLQNFAAANVSTISANIDLGGTTRAIITIQGAADPDLNLSGVISNGAISKGDLGSVRFSGTQANTYSGGTNVNEGTLELAKQNVLAMNGALVIGDAVGAANTAQAKLLAANNLPDNPQVTAQPDGKFDANGFDDTIGPLFLNGGNAQLGSATLNVSNVTMVNASIAGASGRLVLNTGGITASGATTCLISGVIVDLGETPRTFNIANGAAAIDLDIFASVVGSAGLTKAGAGTLRLGKKNDYDITTVSAGNLTIDGSLTHDVNVVGGSLTMNQDANLGSELLSIDVAAPGAVIFNDTQHLASLNVAGAAVLSPAGDRVLVVDSFATQGSGTLDLADNSMIVDYVQETPIADVQRLINTAREGGSWGGAGLTSNVARNANPKNRTLGAMESTDFWSIYGQGARFQDEEIDDRAVLVKFTFYGDADFNDHVDFDDYSHIDNGFGNARGGWLNGDFDGNGAIDFDDYSLIDNAFNTQNVRTRSTPTWGGRLVQFID